MNSNQDSRQSRVPENDTSKAMDSKREVDQSPDEKTDQDFPGYPHYPAKEDIMSQNSGQHRVDANLEEMGSGPNASGVSQRYAPAGGAQQGPRSNEAQAEGESNNQAALDSRSEETGTPQNVSNEDAITNRSASPDSPTESSTGA